MVELIVPLDRTILIRRKAGLDKKKSGLWHFIKKGSIRKGICATIIPSLYEVERTTLSEIKNVDDICAKCWSFSKFELETTLDNSE